MAWLCRAASTFFREHRINIDLDININNNNPPSNSARRVARWPSRQLMQWRRTEVPV